MWNRLSLRGHIFFLLFSLVGITVAVGLMALWYALRVDGIMTTVVNRSTAAMRASEELTIALVEQKGITTYYFQDRDPQWLERLSQKNQNFRQWLDTAMKGDTGPEGMRLLQSIDTSYENYVQARDTVLERYRAGAEEEGTALHKLIRSQFASLLDLCQDYRHIHETALARSNKDIAGQLEAVRNASLATMPAVVVLGIFLAWVIVRMILRPIRQMADQMNVRPGVPLRPDDISDLGIRVRGLLDDVDSTHDQLERSQESLKQSEKWALTGKLAAGVAHSIRNPLTSVKIRLFSLGRSLRLNDDQKEDFEVITEEIRHIDGIARNFLEFSRPPKLQIQDVDVSDIVESALTLLRHRLDSYEVDIVHNRSEKSLPIHGDPDQLKEVLVNLLINACDAMGRGGSITLSAEKGYVRPMGDIVTLKVRDTGPGISEQHLSRLFQPFYSSKEEGTGLGLSIAKRIVEEHNGTITVKSRLGEGTTFTITLPAQEKGTWHRFS
ncbi:ATP-binding protein [Desulfobaculum bizertense]|uniref:histidine kinase n=1 Tax=Desulfobaculum bizertense DSM 18034 TaxID=1121442 RepID=A0A1T4VJ88_9BACT|nr:ATP-binding protein [Desulfobaculum bizertense]UIJ37956.1 ATP-binding protein [Desulfobaculum bizertense]SKA64983.1 HAMP domain-containing protein [Desulfobaculum bizertense DSM 18034]